MKRNRLSYVAAAAACIPMMLPPSAQAAPPTHTSDVALQAGGLLVGQVVDQQGVPKASAPVSVQYGEQEVARAITDANGYFAVQGLRGGQYQLLTNDGSGMYRLWAADTAPPPARPAALVVTGTEVVRGQPGCADCVDPHCGHPVGYGPTQSWIEWMKCHPYIVAGTIAAAIAIPVSLAHRRDRQPVS